MDPAAAVHDLVVPLLSASGQLTLSATLTAGFLAP